MKTEIENEIKNLFNHYHNKVTEYPTLYTSENLIQVVLPDGLLQFANAAAGHGNYRPIGIRRTSYNPMSAIKEVFSSVESLTDFILSSECDAISHIKQLKLSAAVKKQKAELTRNVFWTKYNKSTMDTLKSLYNKNKLRTAYDTLSMSEFELEFNL